MLCGFSSHQNCGLNDIFMKHSASGVPLQQQKVDEAVRKPKLLTQGMEKGSIAHCLCVTSWDTVPSYFSICLIFTIWPPEGHITVPEKSQF